MWSSGLGDRSWSIDSRGDRYAMHGGLCDLLILEFGSEVHSAPVWWEFMSCGRVPITE